MRALFLPLFLAMLVTAFAGCVGSDASPASDPRVPEEAGPAAFDDNSGAIAGTIFDDETNPVPGAQVGLLGAEGVVATSAADGRFTLNNVPPGRQVLAVQKLGYESSTRAVDVVVGEVAEVTINLLPIKLVEIYQSTITFKGYFDCTWVIPTSSGPCGFIGATNGTTGNPLEPLWVNSKRKWNYPVAANLMTILNEVTWKKGTLATGEKMGVIMSHGPIDGKERSTSHFFCRATGFNPVRMHWERADIEDDGECTTGSSQVSSGPKTIHPNGMLMQSFVSSGAGANPAGGDLPAGFAYQQSFELIISMFYGEIAPEGYTAYPDG